MMREAAERHGSVALVVVGADLDPAEVTRALGLEGHRRWRRGERKNYVGPDGTTRYFDSVYEDGGWKHFLPARYKDRPLREQVHLWLARLRDLGDAIKTLTERGWEAELDCFAIGSEVLVLSTGELRELADLGVGLALTLACGVERADV